jgi:hypothetical protein
MDATDLMFKSSKFLNFVFVVVGQLARQLPRDVFSLSPFSFRNSLESSYCKRKVSSQNPQLDLYFSKPKVHSYDNRSRKSPIKLEKSTERTFLVWNRANRTIWNYTRHSIPLTGTLDHNAKLITVEVIT